jgi:multiple sugar transport system ATP-binding protein
MIAGLEPISEGHIKFGDRIVNKLPPKDRDIAMVFQSYALYPHMSVEANMGFGLKMQKVPPAEIERRVRDAAATLGLAQLLARKPKELSGGQRQRVAMGRALVRSPQAFLFDEPLSNLDAGLRAQMRVEIKKLHRRLGTTSVYVTHDQIEAMSLADRIAIMDRGKLMQVGAPLDVYNNPANVFVAQFVGSPAINLLEGKLVTEGGNSSLHLKGGETISLPPTLAKNFAKSSTDRVVLGIRAQDVKSGSQNSANGVLVHGIVEVIERIGPVRVAHVHTPAGVGKCMQGVDATHVGEALTVSLPESRCLAFDAASGNRLNFMGH